MPAKPSYEELERKLENLQTKYDDLLLKRDDLKQSEKDYILKSFHSCSPMGMNLLDEERKLHWPNLKLARMTGYSIEELEGIPSRILYSTEEEYNRVAELKSENLTKSDISSVDTKWVRKDGNIIEVVLTEKLLNPHKPSDGIINCAQVVTNQKITHEALVESEERFLQIAEKINAVFYIYDPVSGKFLYISPTYEYLWQEPVQSLYDDPLIFTYAVHPDDRDRIFEAVQNEREKGQYVNLEYRIVRPDGTIRWLWSRNFPVLDENGAEYRVVGIAEDISERKEAEEHMAIMAAILDIAPSSITVHDTHGRFFYANHKTFEIHGYEKNEFMELNLKDLDVPESCDDQKERFRKIAEDGEASFEAEHYKKDGTIIPLEVFAKSIDWQGKPAVLSIATDITERRKVEAEREELQNHLRQSQKMEAIGTLAGGVAHDFNNILSIILGNAEMAMHDIPVGSAAQENLNEVREASLRARDLVTQILFFARQKEQAISNIRLEPIAKECMKMLRASIPTTVEIQQKFEDGLPPVYADPSQIQQIIMNLFTNAAQAMESEGGTLEFSLDSTELERTLITQTGRIPEGTYVRLKVLDTGSGIADDELERIFEPFYTTKGVGEGTGLGLAVVHGIVTERNGGVVVESTKGEGTAFTVYLPASEEASTELGFEEKPELPKGTERILFVDDEPMIMKLGQRMLERQGYTVESRASGIDALECFRNDPDRFDLIVTDMTMPGMRGDKLAEQIISIRPELPVILNTGYSNQISEEKARSIGIRAFVLKPLTHHELAKTVRKVLDGK